MSIASEEEYRPILEYEGYYEVSNYGNVKSVDRYVNHPQKGYSFKKGKTLSKSYSKKTGYFSVSLYKNGICKTFLVHRLVAKAFPEICGKMFEHCEIDHIDTNRKNNNVYNLRVCTRNENHLNPISRIHYKKCAEHIKNLVPWNKGLKLPKQSGANHFNAKAVTQYDKNKNVINIYNTIAEASKKTNILRTCIDNCLNGRSKTAGGYIWEYVVGGVNNVN